MFNKRSLCASTFALIALTAACEDDGTQPLETELPVADLMEISLQVDDMLGSVLNTFHTASSDDIPAPSMDLIVTDVEFERTRTCPAGGQVAVSGTAHREFDTETRVRESEYAGTRTRTDCAFVRNEHTVTVNGSGDWTATRRRVEGAFDGPQVSTHSGSFEAVRSDGEARSCEFDVEVVRDPDAMTKTITGTICGEAVDRTKEWNPAA